MTDFPDIGYGTVHGRFLAGALDSADAGVAPDAEPLSGSVTFAPTASVIAVVSAAPPATFFPQPLTVQLDAQGRLSRDGSTDISLWATDDQSGNPYDWQWRVTFNLHHKGRGVFRAPFNFELPMGSIIDLTVVAPVATPSPGTIIIRGPQGPPGASVTDLITAKGDMVAGTGFQEAAIISVGADGEYLTPDPAAETGLAWKPLPEGIKTYASLAEVEAVRAPEVGTLHVDNLAATFPQLAAVGSGVESVFASTGPADLLISTSLNSDTNEVTIVGQVFEVYTLLGVKYLIKRTVGIEFPFEVPWDAHPEMPATSNVGDMPVLKSTGGWGTVPSDFWQTPNAVVVRDQAGRARVEDPADVLDIANKQYVDGAIENWVPYAGINQALIGVGSPTGPVWEWKQTGADFTPDSFMLRGVDGTSQIADPVDPLDIVNKQTLDAAVATAGLKHYADMAALDAVRVGEVGVLHVANMNAAFPYLSAGSATFAADGPGELVVESHVSDSPVGTTETMILQSFLVNDYATDTPRQVTRYLYFDITTGVASITSEWVMGQPLPTPQADYSIIGTNNTPSAWIKVRARSNADPSGLIRRDTSGRAQVANPAAAQDIANKQYVDSAIGAIPPPALPPRLGTTAQVITDWNLAIENGWFMGSGALNAPEPGIWFIAEVLAHNDSYVIQTLYTFTDSAAPRSYRRDRIDGSWSPWRDGITLPPRLGMGSKRVIDWNTATDNGYYYSDAGAGNAPFPVGAWLGTVTAYSPLDSYLEQEVYCFANDATYLNQRYRRRNYVGQWSAWERVYDTFAEVNSLQWAPNSASPPLHLAADTAYVTVPTTPGLILVDGGGNIQFQELGKSYIVRHTGVTPNPTGFTAHSNNGRGPGRITPGQSILVYTGTDPIPVTNFTLLDGAVFRANPGIPDSNAQVITNADSGKLYSTGAGIWNVSLVNPGPVALNSPIVLWPLNGCVLTITPDTTAIGPRVISEGPVRLDWDYNTWVIEPMFTPPTPPTWGRWSGTQAAYDAIAVKDPNTLYVVV